MRNRCWLLALAIPWLVAAQVPCSSNPLIQGFETIASLNTAMSTELARIAGGGTPEVSYQFILCPDTTFDTSSEPLRPVLSGASFLCGEAGISPGCIFSGGSEQIRILDSTVATYPLETLLFSGITFERFTASLESTGASINALAGSTTTATFENVAWSMFVSNFAVRQVVSGGQTPMTVNVIDSTIIDGTSDTSVFLNDGGILDLSTMAVQGLTAEVFVNTINGGNSTLTASNITQSSIQRVTETESTGSQLVDNVIVSDMVAMATTFYARQSGTSLVLFKTTLENNMLSSPWTGVEIVGAAQGRIEETVFATSTQMEFGIVAAGPSTIVSVLDSFLINHVGPGPDAASTPLFVTVQAQLDVTRTELNNNTAYAGQALAFLGSSISFSECCFQDISATRFLVFVDHRETTFAVANNFVSNAVTENCAVGNRLFLEDQGGGCFQQGVCTGTCQVLADSATCQAQPPTVSPSANPSGPTISPSALPTATPTFTPVPTTPFPTTSPTVSPTGLPTTAPPTTVVPATIQPTRCPDPRPPTNAPTRGRRPIKPLKPLKPRNPHKPQKMKLGPRGSILPGMKMRPLPESRSFFRHWITNKTVKSKEQEESSESTPTAALYYAWPTPRRRGLQGDGVTCAPIREPPPPTPTRRGRQPRKPSPPQKHKYKFKVKGAGPPVRAKTAYYIGKSTKISKKDTKKWNKHGKHRRNAALDESTALRHESTALRHSTAFRGSFFHMI